MNFIELILLGCGIYMLYLTFKMKSTGEIPAFFVNNKVKLSSARDKDGYIKYMFPRFIVFSVVIIVFACITLLGDVIILPTWVIVTINLGYFAIIVLLTVISVKAQNKYLF